MKSEIVELEAKLETAELNGIERVECLNRLSWKLWTTEAERAEAMAQEALTLAEALNYQRGIAFAKRNLGIFHYLRAEVEEALAYQLDALRWFEEHDEREGIGTVNLVLAYLYWSFGDFQRGFDCAFKALELSREGRAMEGQAWSHNALGVFYFDWKNHQESRKHFQLARDLFSKIDDSLGEARALNGIGNAYRFAGDYQQALDYQKQSLQIYESRANSVSRSKTLNDIGLIYQDLGEYEQALSYHRESLRLRQEASYSAGETTTLLDIGDILTRQGKLEEAQEVFSKALVLSEFAKAKPKICRAHRSLSNLFKQMGRHEEALKHHEEFHALEESVFHEDNEKRVKNLQAAYQLEASRKETEIFRLRNVELKEKNEQLEETLRKLNAAQAQLLQSGRMAALGNLVAGIAHEINNPIGTIKSAADVYQRGISKLLERAESQPLLVEDFTAHPNLSNTLQVLRENNQTMTTAIDRVQRTIQTLKRFVRLDESPLQETNINKDLDNTLTLIRQEIREGVTVIKDFANLPPVHSNPSELNQVFMNLLLNASQAVAPAGIITIKTFTTQHHVHVEISDNGKGIPEEKLAQLFEPGFTQRGSKVRMRTGLFTSYSIIQKHNGDIRVESEVGKGTQVTVSLPTNSPFDKLPPPTTATP